MYPWSMLRAIKLCHGSHLDHMEVICIPSDRFSAWRFCRLQTLDILGRNSALVNLNSARLAWLQ